MNASPSLSPAPQARVLPTLPLTPVGRTNTAVIAGKIARRRVSAALRTRAKKTGV